MDRNLHSTMVRLKVDNFSVLLLFITYLHSTMVRLKGYTHVDQMVNLSQFTFHNG
ncbi:MAG: hypothetical protein ACRCZ2_02610 [Fusobacteriaceae bacterium]